MSAKRVGSRVSRRLGKVHARTLYGIGFVRFFFSGISVTGHGMERYARYSEHRGFFFSFAALHTMPRRAASLAAIPNETKNLR